jgi:hypothetical protein
MNIWLTSVAVDAGASPKWASVLAAIHSLVDRASVTEPNVSTDTFNYHDQLQGGQY